MRAGDVGLFRPEVGKVVGPRHAVVHQRSGDELAAVVVDAILQKRLADALGEAAVYLAGDDHRVHHLAHVVDRDPVKDGHLAGVLVHLDFADVGT